MIHKIKDYIETKKQRQQMEDAILDFSMLLDDMPTVIAAWCDDNDNVLLWNMVLCTAIQSLEFSLYGKSPIVNGNERLELVDFSVDMLMQCSKIDRYTQKYEVALKALNEEKQAMNKVIQIKNRGNKNVRHKFYV